MGKEGNNYMANRMEDKIIKCVLVIDRVKLWRRSNMREGH
jgi:hypothetical protein